MLLYFTNSENNNVPSYELCAPKFISILHNVHSKEHSLNRVTESSKPEPHLLREVLGLPHLFHLC